MPKVARIERLRLTDFRNYAYVDLVTGSNHVVLVGGNGAGKTNILEAVSFLSPGRGLRRAAFNEIGREGVGGAWAVAASLEGAHGFINIGTGVQKDAMGGLERNRRIRMDQVAVKSSDVLCDHVRVLWLTPAQDGLFTGSPANRRRFLDRLVLAIEPRHGRTVSAFEMAMRDRNRLLEEVRADSSWLDAVEASMADAAIAIAAARVEFVDCIRKLIAATYDPHSAFPHADIELDGVLEKAIAGQPALEVEDTYRVILQRGRSRDRAAGRTLEGPHRTDLIVRHGPKNIAAAKASTGEQKALLLGFILAHAELVGSMSGIMPILLLDEIAAHLDHSRREALFRSIENLGGQAWMSGTDPELFEAVGKKTRIFTVENGTVKCVCSADNF